ncbi:MAG: flavin reductase family protein [Pseudomonadota bacterium]
MTTSELTIDQVKSFHHKFVTGVTVVTTSDGSEPRGLVVNAFSSLSLDPPMIIVCVQKTSSSYDSLFARDHLAVNVLAADQVDVAKRFASKAPDKFAAVPWTSGPFGSPLLEGVAAWLEAELTERIQASTHTMFIARLVAVGHFERPPLLYAAGQFFDGGKLHQV